MRDGPRKVRRGARGSRVLLETVQDQADPAVFGLEAGGVEARGPRAAGKGRGEGWSPSGAADPGDNEVDDDAQDIQEDHHLQGRGQEGVEHGGRSFLRLGLRPKREKMYSFCLTPIPF